MALPVVGLTKGIASILGDLAHRDVRVGVHRRLRILVPEELLRRLPADLADERIASTVATAVELEIFAGFGVEIGDIGFHREMNHTAAPSRKTITPTCPSVVTTNPLVCVSEYVMALCWAAAMPVLR